MALNPPVAIVTGCNTGVGFHAAGMLGQKGYKVIAACRSKEKGERALLDIKAKYGVDITITLELLDLSSLASVRSFVAAFSKEHSTLKLLVCNGGVSPSSVPHEPEKQLSKDGVDLLYQTNYLSHFLLTLMLLPKLQASSGRVVSLSSSIHRGALPSQLALSSKVRDPYVALYGFSKLAQIASTEELHRRFKGTGVAFHTYNPGGTASDMYRDFPWYKRAAVQCCLISPEKAARTLVHACVSKEGAAPSAPQYWHGYRWAGSCEKFELWSPLSAGESLVASTPSDTAVSTAFATQLWDESIASLKAAGVEVNADGTVQP